MTKVRKICQFVESVHEEGSRAVDPPTRVAVTAAVVTDFLAGQWADDLSDLIAAYSDQLGTLLATQTATLLGGKAEAFGKGVIVGTDVEIEHGSAIVHNLQFGNPVRKAAGDASSLLPAVEKRGAPGATIDIPMKHVHDGAIRSHHQSFEIRIADAPCADEIVVAVAMATQGRPHARLAPSTTDLGAAQ